MPKIRRRVGKNKNEIMAIELINAKDGDKFEAKSGLKLTYYAEGRSLSHAPYHFCLKSDETGNKYFYSNEGEYFEGKDWDYFNLEEQFVIIDEIAYWCVF